MNIYGVLLAGAIVKARKRRRRPPSWSKLMCIFLIQTSLWKTADCYLAMCQNTVFGVNCVLTSRYSSTDGFPRRSISQKNGYAPL